MEIDVLEVVGTELEDVKDREDELEVLEDKLELDDDVPWAAFPCIKRSV